MDYLDPKKQLRYHVVLLVGYVFVAVAISIAALIMLYYAYGFGLGKHGTVIQNGLTFFSSQPHPANIYINDQLNSSQTNARLVLPEGIYHVKLTRTGYRDWQRTIELDGGTVVHFDYPVLFPTKLASKKLGSYSTAPGLMTQSPDRRWLLVEQPGSATNFDVYDLKNPSKAPVSLTLPSTIVSKAASGESWQLEEWADDNRHLVLQHNFDGKSEYILVDRVDATQSLNLNTTLSATPSKLTLNNKKYDQYYLYAATTKTLQKATLKTAAVVAQQHVLAYQSYGNNELLYVTDQGAPSGKVLVKLSIGQQSYTIHSLPISSNYLLDLTKYSNTLYVAAGATGDNKVYIYKDPVGQLQASPGQAPAPIQVLHVNQPDYLSFSTNAQFVVAEHANQFGVYDILNQNGYNYTATQPLDAPQAHASWMDGNRLTYVSAGRLLVFDYDNTNQQTLMAAEPNYLPAFAPDYKYVYDMTPVTGQTELDQTALLTPPDL